MIHLEVWFEPGLGVPASAIAAIHRVSDSALVGLYGSRVAVKVELTDEQQANPNEFSHYLAEVIRKSSDGLLLDLEIAVISTELTESGK